MVIGLTGSCMTCVAINAKEANFSIATINPKLTGSAAWIALVLCLVWQLLVFRIVLGIILHWAS
jgi:hypothetical protein